MRILPILPVFVCMAMRLAAQQSAAFVLSEGSVYTPSVKTILYKLGEKTVPLKIGQYGDRNDLVFINLHDDEITSVEATKRILEKEGGLLIEVENDLQRNLRFRLAGKYYSVDPNRIFSGEGIIKSLRERGVVSSKAIEEAGKLANRIIELIPAETAIIIALHNNGPEMFSAISYSAGNRRSVDAAKVYLDPQQDPDDFFFTTDEELYELLANSRYNTVLQDNKNCIEDGSLSVYCGKRNIRYVNCETEHGKLDQYYQMIRALLDALTASDKKSPPDSGQ